jgi:ABC-type dipeptide/oligopeptide/nickel transport system permease subunit
MDTIGPASEAASQPTDGLKLRGGPALRAFAQDHMALASAIFLLLVVLVSLAAPLIAPHDPLKGYDAYRLAPPLTPGYLLGTDGQGRDILSRILWGGRISLFSALMPAVLALPIALILGLVAGYFGKWVDQLIMRSLDVLFAFPMVLLAIAIGGALGPGLWTEIIAIGVVLVPYMSRVVYSVTQTIKESEFVEAARASGAGSMDIVLAEVMPNVLPALIVFSTSILGRIMIVAAGLSFFGLGAGPPTADWGLMINENRTALGQDPGASIIPGLMVVLVSLCFNFIGDGLRDMLDPYRSG